ncbi:heat shock protein 90-6, mitochondrial-like [Rutidosis leptorrhynchoides]|uniref:heat shock protein 90-6, mitochondrial-like n=1 Tax=Rutidosis leptorrhynchoides TaxID=125765 RepID=UPI003A9A1D11
MHRLSRRSVNSLFNNGAHRRRAVAVAAVSVYSLHVNQTVADVRWKPGRMIPTWNRWYESSSSNFQTNIFDPVHKYEYQAEVSRLMDLIANSIYSNKEVFLRELISNASDALDKLRLLSVTEPQLLEGGPELDIRIQTDQDNGIITLTDSGIGMTHDELVDSLGTIVADTGTAKFLEAFKDSKDAGQFGGVGFYSAFLVADKVVVSTKSPKSDKQYVWEGEAYNSRSYIIREETDPDKFIPRGTSIKLHLKRDDKGFANPDIIQRLIKKHSQVVSFPIYTWQEKGYTKEVEVDDDQAEVDVEIKKKTKKKIVEKYWDWELITNEIQPIWLRNPKEVTRAEYNELYKKAFNDYLEPLASSHFTTEEDVEFSSILYVPAIIPMEEEEIVDDIKTKNIRLYVKHVFISSDFDTELFPGYLSFVKGVVDSNDLPLNVSREIFQDSPIVRIMRKRLVHKAFDMILLLSKGENREDYEKFWDNFGKHLKLGCIEDHENHYRLAPLLRFFSSHSSKMISLDEYVENMKPDQKDIYYVAVDNVESAMVNPVMERLCDKDLQVLFLVDDPIDEFAVRELKWYKGKNFVDISKEDFILGDNKNEEKEKEMKQEFEQFCIWMKKILGDKVDDVQVSNRLTVSPCVIVSG